MTNRIFVRGMGAVAGALILGSTIGRGHDAEARVIRFPDLPDYVTLVADLHQHTVFSDGNVWPTIRVEEGVRDGVDVMAITDHLEYQPHRQDIPHPDRNRGHDLAAAKAKQEIMVVRGAEITRSMPPGHMNAVFIEDANVLRVEDPVEALREAKRQGAFTFWNHPAWQSQAADGVARLTPLHQQLLAEKLFGGIEVVNEKTFSESTLSIALEHDLTIMGTSDIHGLIDWEYAEHPHAHRPVTLVFAEERTPAAVKAALFAGRTVVWFGNTLIGRERWVEALLTQSITLRVDAYLPKSTVLKMELENHSDAEFLLRNVGVLRLYNQADMVTLRPHAKLMIEVITESAAAESWRELEFEVLNAVTAPSVHPVVKLAFPKPPVR